MRYYNYIGNSLNKDGNTDPDMKVLRENRCSRRREPNACPPVLCELISTTAAATMPLITLCRASTTVFQNAGELLNLVRGPVLASVGRPDA